MARVRRVWLITDTHFYHRDIDVWCGRPHDHNELLIRNLQTMLCPLDTLVHLGDVILRNQQQLAGIMASIPGTKILVRGNHDKESDSWYTRRGFAVVCESIVIKDVLLSHKPQIIPAHIRLNVHGHFHNTDHHIHEPHFQAILEPRHRLLAVEYTNYKPVDFDVFCR